MFLISMKLTVRKTAAVAAVLALIICAAVLWPRNAAQASTAANSGEAASAAGSAQTESAAVTPDRKVTGISTNEARVGFLESYGWKVDASPAEVVEITIPNTFNAVYQNYNNLQRKQGFDLAKYKGARCKRWTYRVTNYPGVSDEVRANLLVCGNRIVGGDISTVALNGFMHGFSAPEDADAMVNIKPSAAYILSGAVDVAVSDVSSGS